MLWGLKDKSMKKIKSESTDELRPEYKRSYFGELVRGKYANLTNVFHIVEVFKRSGRDLQTPTGFVDMQQFY